jgi:hypothetical protein
MILITTLFFTYTDTAFAKKYNDAKKNDKVISQQDKKQENRKKYEYKKDKKHKDKKQEFKLYGVPVIKYDKYKLPIAPITQGMGATVIYDKVAATITVKKGETTIVIRFKDKTVTINGVTDTFTNSFKGIKGNGTIVLIKYIANVLGIRADVDDDDIIIEEPILDKPTDITITTFGASVVANTINATTQHISVTAKIKAGQATGGKAELYVGSKLIATDSSISATDTMVEFTTHDGTPTNEELKAMIPTGGKVTIRLYNSTNNYVSSSTNGPTLQVDYIAPTITGILSAVFDPAKNQIALEVTGAGAIGDRVDVTKFMLYDQALGRYYQLTNTAGSGSSGEIKSANSIVIQLGSVDMYQLTDFRSATMLLTVTAGSLLKDVAGNTAIGFAINQTVPLTLATVLDQPTNVQVTPIGTNVVANSLNRSTTHMNASALIKAGQAAGGKAELYVGTRLIATDASISATDTTVNFTTSDGTPTNAELQALVPAGGVVTVKLYNKFNNVVTSTVSNPSLAVDYVAPKITGINSAIYDVKNNQIYMVVTGAGGAGDYVDVTKLSLYDATFAKTYQLTDATKTGSSGVINSENYLIINIGTLDRLALTGYGSSRVYLIVSSGSLLKDAAGNLSNSFTSAQTLEMNVIN